jgi:hypothetical protein
MNVSMNLLDVAVGPLYLIFGLGILLIAFVVFLLFFIAIKLIIKIKKDNDTNV